MADASGGVSTQRVTLTTTSDGWFLAVSAAFLELIDRPVEGLAGLNLIDLAHPSDAAVARRLLSTAVDPNADSSDVSAQVRLFTKGDQWTSVRAVLLDIDDDRFTFVLSEAADRGSSAPTPTSAAQQPLRATRMRSRSRFAGEEVPAARVAIRDIFGDVTTPMLEIDAAGRTVFVRGAWSDLCADQNLDAAETFEWLVVHSREFEAIGSAIDAATGRAETTVVRILEPVDRWIHIRPIPSAQYAGQAHALIAVTHEEHVDESGVEVQAQEPQQGEPAEAAPPGAEPVPPEADLPLRDFEAPEPDTAEPHTAEPHTAEPDTAEPHAAELVATEPAVAEAADTEPSLPLSRSGRVLLAAAAASTYVALQGLYLGPAYGWNSPLKGALESRRCLIQPLCDNNVLRSNHLAVIALLVAVVASAMLFRHSQPLSSSRPANAGRLGATSWRPTLHGPGLIGWFAIAAVVVLSAQTILTDTASMRLWLGALAFGAIAAWRSDRDATRPLESTMAALGLALSCLFVTLGIGTVWLGDRRVIGLVLMSVGAGLFLWALKLLGSQKRGRLSSFDRLDYIAMLALAVLALVLGLARHHTWRYAFIGDEWSFFEGALDRVHGNPSLGTFEIGGPNNYFTGLTFELQASVMQLAGANVWGWRLSALMPMVLSVPAMYAFTRWLGGRGAALVAALALGVGHMLLSFSMIGYNNSQSLVAVAASFAALAWAHQRPSALRFFLLGAAVGSTFLVYAMARLVLLPVGLLFLVLFRKDIAVFARRIGWATLGGIAVAAPALFSLENWDALLKATPVQAEDPVLESGVTRQIFENTFSGWLSFIGSERNTHFIVGPHLDVISAVLLIVGLGFVIARARTDKTMRWFLVGGVGLWTAINAIQQYAQISNTRSFMIPLVYCVFIGLGASAAWRAAYRRLPRIPSFRGSFGIGALGLGAFVLFAAVLVTVNQWHIGGYANDRQQLTEQAMLVQQFELTQTESGEGMPVFVAWPELRNARITMILRAHDVAAERIHIVPPNGVLNDSVFCSHDDPAMLLIHRNHPQRDALTDTFERCWGTNATQITDPFGDDRLTRIMNPMGEFELTLDASERFRLGAATDDYALRDTIDVAVDGAGSAYALTRSVEGASIHRLDGGGSFQLAQPEVIDFDITSEGLFVVAGFGGNDRLAWYDGKGNRVQRFPGQDAFGLIGGIAVEGERLWISDTSRSRVVAVNSSFKVDEVRFGQGQLNEPGAVAPGPDGSVWISSSQSGEVLLVDDQDEVVARVGAQAFNVFDSPRLASTNEGWLIQPAPEHPEIRLINPAGETLDIRGGVNKPRAAGVRDGELIIADPRWGAVPVLAVGDSWSPPDTRGIVTWGSRSAGTTDDGLYTNPFISDEHLSPGKLSIDVIETEVIDVSENQTWRPIGLSILAASSALAPVADGALLVDEAGRALRLDAEAEITSVIGIGASATSLISDVGVDANGTAWILDAGAGQLFALGADDQVSRLASDPGPLRNSRGIGLGSDGTLWIASTAAAQLTHVDTDGATIGAIAVPGRQPTDVVELEDGSLWIVDAEQFELVHLQPDGAVIETLPLAPFVSLESPHLALVGDVLWFSHPELSTIGSVDVLTSKFIDEPIRVERAGGNNIGKAVGIAVSDDGRVWVTDSFGRGIAIYTPS